VDLRAVLGVSCPQRGTHVVAVTGEEALPTGPGTRQRVLVVTCLLQVCDVAGDLVQDRLVHGRQCLGQDTDQFARLETVPDGGATESVEQVDQVAVAIRVVDAEQVPHHSGPVLDGAGVAAVVTKLRTRPVHGFGSVADDEVEVMTDPTLRDEEHTAWVGLAHGQDGRTQRQVGRRGILVLGFLLLRGTGRQQRRGGGGTYRGIQATLPALCGELHPQIAEAGQRPGLLVLVRLLLFLLYLPEQVRAASFGVGSRARPCVVGHEPTQTGAARPGGVQAAGVTVQKERQQYLQRLGLARAVTATQQKPPLGEVEDLVVVLPDIADARAFESVARGPPDGVSRSR